MFSSSPISSPKTLPWSLRLLALPMLASPSHLVSQTYPVSVNINTAKTGAPEFQLEEQTPGPLPSTLTLRPFSVNIYSDPVQ